MIKTYTDKVSGKTLYVREHDGVTQYHKDKEMNILHREDGPAFIDGSVFAWYQNDIIHRLDGPAYVNDKTNIRMWMVNGMTMKLSYLKHLQETL